MKTMKTPKEIVKAQIAKDLRRQEFLKTVELAKIRQKTLAPIAAPLPPNRANRPKLSSFLKN